MKEEDQKEEEEKQEEEGGRERKGGKEENDGEEEEKEKKKEKEKEKNLSDIPKLNCRSSAIGENSESKKKILNVLFLLSKQQGPDNGEIQGQEFLTDRLREGSFKKLTEYPSWTIFCSPRLFLS